jgi:methyl-accepting chemotaxis protein
VKSAAEGARSVENTMSDAGAEAERSGQVVQNAVAAMSEIEKSSRHISQIISVIDDISFQTNLLALNAGVEAARAGEAGRGFAVVASEVRGLAQRSSDAAMEIKALISDSSKQVDGGVKLVGNAGEALESIVGQVSHITTLVSEIAEGAAEQSTGLYEINTGMTQLDQVTQQNAAMVEQSTAASHLLKSDATKLTELMSHFKFTQSEGAGRSPSMPTAPTAHGSDDDWAMDTVAVTPVAATGTDGKATWQDF